MTTQTLVILIAIVVVAGAFRVGFYNDSWGYAPVGILMAILIVLLVWAVVTGRTPSTTGADIRAGVQETGHELKEVGRDAADSVRKAVQ